MEVVLTAREKDRLACWSCDQCFNLEGNQQQVNMKRRPQRVRLQQAWHANQSLCQQEDYSNCLLNFTISCVNSVYSRCFTIQELNWHIHPWNSLHFHTNFFTLAPCLAMRASVCVQQPVCQSTRRLHLSCFCPRAIDKTKRMLKLRYCLSDVASSRELACNLVVSIVSDPWCTHCVSFKFGCSAAKGLPFDYVHFRRQGTRIDAQWWLVSGHFEVEGILDKHVNN